VKGVASHATSGSPNYNEKGLWIHSEEYKLKKAWLEANGKGDDQPELRWYEYAMGWIIRGAQHPGEKSRPDRSGRMQEKLVGQRPDRVLQMSMATSQRHGG
jgi:hypothetical protein